MNLIEVYIHEVVRRLPEKNRQDIALELKSTVEDMLPEDYSEKEVKLVLENLGSPVTLASGYRDLPMHLIGPHYYDTYITLFKMIVPIAAIVAVIALLFAEFFMGYRGEESILTTLINLFSFGLAKIIEVGIQVFFWLTLTFAILERMDKGKEAEPITASLKKWSPDDLKNIPYIPKEKAISKVEIFGSLLWTAIWASLYFNANYLVGIYRDSGSGLEFVTPFLNQDILRSFWPVVLVVFALEIGLALYKLIQGRQTKKMAIITTAAELIGHSGLYCHHQHSEYHDPRIPRVYG